MYVLRFRKVKKGKIKNERPKRRKTRKQRRAEAIAEELREIKKEDRAWRRKRRKRRQVEGGHVVIRNPETKKRLRELLGPTYSQQVAAKNPAGVRPLLTIEGNHSTVPGHYAGDWKIEGSHSTVPGHYAELDWNDLRKRR
jgi:hypothetical protein